MDPIKYLVRVDKIDSARQPFGGQVDRAVLDDMLVDAPGWKSRAPTDLDVRLTRMSGGVLLEAAGRLHLSSDCRRCLTEVQSDLPLGFTLNLVRRHPEPVRSGDADDDLSGERAASFDPQLADEEFFDGDQIDLRPLLREQILLALPPIEPLCRDECKGLCSTCGQDRNERDCGHATRPPDPRLAALANFKPVQ